MVTKPYSSIIALAENGQILYIVTDHLNAPQIVMDSTGKSIWSAKYNEFGQATIISNYKLNIRADGQYQDDETALYYNWHRYYNPDLGRYITSDPLGLQAGINTYVYVNSDAINNTDPTGLFSIVDAGVVVTTAAVIARTAPAVYRAYKAYTLVNNPNDSIINKSCDDDSAKQRVQPNLTPMGDTNGDDEYECFNNGKPIDYQFKGPGVKKGKYVIDKKGAKWSADKLHKDHYDVQIERGHPLYDKIKKKYLNCYKK